MPVLPIVWMSNGVTMSVSLHRCLTTNITVHHGWSSIPNCPGENVEQSADRSDVFMNIVIIYISTENLFIYPVIS